MSTAPASSTTVQNLTVNGPHGDLPLRVSSSCLPASGEALAAEPDAAGVDVTTIVEPGTRHGHLIEPDAERAVRSLRRITEWLTLVLPPTEQSNS